MFSRPTSRSTGTLIRKVASRDGVLWPRVVPSCRRMVSSSTLPSTTLYQYAICPFCNQAKTLLEYVDIPYEAVEVNPLTKAELKPWSGGYRKVPIATIDGKQVNGSSEIVATVLAHPGVASTLHTKWTGGMTMDAFQSSVDSKKWQAFAKEELASLLYPNICRTLWDSYRAFGYVQDVSSFGSFQKLSIRGLGSIAMYLAASKIKSKRGIEDEQEALDRVLTKWEVDGLGNNKLFSSGTTIPSLGDMAVFGVLRSVEGLPAHDKAIQSRGGIIPEWYNRMKEQLRRSPLTEGQTLDS